MRAVVDGKDQEARLAMANGSLMAGVAFSNSMVGVVHAIGHACGGVCHVPHAEAMTILLSHCMKLNLSICEEDYARILLAFLDQRSIAKLQRSNEAKKMHR